MQKQTVHLFVFDGLADWEAGLAIAGLNRPAFQLQPGRYGVQTVGLKTEPATTMGGIGILPGLTLKEFEPSESAMLILPGGDAWDAGANDEATGKAVSFLGAGVPVAAICAATAALARAGALDDKRHTSNARDYLKATNYRGEALYQDQPAVTDGNVITASGVAPVDFAYHIFNKLGVYSAQTLESWYGLFKTGDPWFYSALVKSAEVVA
jgi:putative intracellular protease/amidase